MSARPGAPRDVAELESRLSRIAGRTLGELAEAARIDVPNDFRRAKGWVGMLVEWHLGTTAASRAEPDFPHLGIELKTLPIRADGEPRESTFVATFEPDDPASYRWETSVVRRKLARVTWVPVQADETISIAERRIGTGLVLPLAPDDEKVLRADYEAIVELVAEGFGERISARHGTWLQMRPKGADAASLRWTRDEEGNPVRTRPRGFYLRTQYTSMLLSRHWRS